MSFESRIHEKEEKVNLANPLSREKLNELYKQDTLKGVGYILLDVVLIAGAIMLTEEYFHPLLYILAIMFIGNRQHSLLIQMHDAAHKNVSKNAILILSEGLATDGGCEHWGVQVVTANDN